MFNDFDISSLRKHHENKEWEQKQIYERIYQRCLARIIYTNNELSGTKCNFSVPTIEPGGFPLFNVQECVNYIWQKLSENGLQVYLVDTHTLDIDWSTALYPRMNKVKTPKHVSIHTPTKAHANAPHTNAHTNAPHAPHAQSYMQTPAPLARPKRVSRKAKQQDRRMRNQSAIQNVLRGF